MQTAKCVAILQQGIPPWFICWVKKAAVLETDLSFTTQRTSVEREYTGCDAAALLLYFIFSFSGCTV